MKRHYLKTLAFALATVLCFGLLTACAAESASKSSKDYWFSSYERKFVAYDEAKNNLDEAGSYWTMTVKNDCNVTLSVRVNVQAMSSSMYFYVNGNQVQSETETDIYSFVYKDLQLKKGDQLEMHAFWVNSLMTDDKGFEISVFSISDGADNYLITDIK